MKFQDFKNPKFITTAMAPKDFPVLRNKSGNIVDEIAVAGRSNVGKSSLLNDVFQSKNMVKTSSTPGKTQAINFFILNDKLGFVDLPGYGFAEVPAEVRRKWGPMVQGYLQEREQLKLVLLLFDIRRMPNEEDMQMLEWAAHYNKSLILVLTKVDKVNQSEKIQNTRKILKAFNTENLHYVHYSVPKSVGRRELIHMVMDALKSEEEANGIFE
jgi:GTP-binding protein